MAVMDCQEETKATLQFTTLKVHYKHLNVHIAEVFFANTDHANLNIVLTFKCKVVVLMRIK